MQGKSGPFAELIHEQARREDRKTEAGHVAN
jgi:hypothetical protein